MDRSPSPKDLHGAAAVARSLAYVVGIAGIVAGTIVYRADSAMTLAVVIWVITFAAGAVLMIAGFLCDGLASLLARTASLEQELWSVTRTDGTTHDPPPDDGWTGHPNQW